MNYIPIQWQEYFDPTEIGDIMYKLDNSTTEYQPMKYDIFRCFNYFGPSDCKVVILGQDPYPTKGAATGLAFANPPNFKNTSKTLNNIIKELKYNFPYSTINISNNLESWATQGVLLLNSILTIEIENINSHKYIGWVPVTNKIITKLSQEKTHIVFMLWGKVAHSKEKLIWKDNGHMILKTTHPSPLSCNKGVNSFNNSNCFNLANNFLEDRRNCKINWIT